MLAKQLAHMIDLEEGFSHHMPVLNYIHRISRRVALHYLNTRLQQVWSTMVVLLFNQAVELGLNKP